jgi:signal transduction histidine kinase
VLRGPAPDEAKFVHATAALRFAASACRSIAVRSRATLTFEVPDQLPAVALRFSELVPLVVNVVSNAVHAVAGGDVPGGRVEVVVHADADSLVLEVRDDGPGIPPEVLAKIGRPFFSTRPEGTGLGVGQSRRIVEAAQGALRIESAPGQGTRVVVRIPRASATR